MPACAGRSNGAVGYTRSADLGPGTQLVLGQVAVNPGFSQLPVRIRGNGPWRYWQKRAILIRTRTGPVTVTVPASWRHRAALTYGTAGIVGSLVLTACQDPPDVWDAYAGGLYLRHRTNCVPLIFRLGKRTTTVRISVTSRC